MSEAREFDPYVVPHGSITMVAARGSNGVIGDGGQMPWRIPEDFAHFKRLTMGHVQVMGRTTYESIGRPLPGRSTVVLTRDPGWSAGEHADQVRVAHSLPEAFEVAATLDGEVMIQGGGQVYAQALPYATHQVITEVDLSPDGDARYPDFDEADWHEMHRVTGPRCVWRWLRRIPEPQRLA